MLKKFLLTLGFYFFVSALNAGGGGGSEGLAFEEDLSAFCEDGHLSVSKILEAQKNKTSGAIGRKLILFAENLIKVEALKAEIDLENENLVLIEATGKFLENRQDLDSALIAVRQAIDETGSMITALEGAASDEHAYASDCQIMKGKIDALHARKEIFRQRESFLQKTKDKDFLTAPIIGQLEEQKAKKTLDLASKKAILEKMPSIIESLRQEIIAAFQGKVDITEDMLSSYFQNYRKIPKGTLSAVAPEKTPQRRPSLRNLREAVQDFVSPSPSSPRRGTNDSPAMQRRKTLSASALSLPGVFPQDYANLKREDLEGVFDGQGYLIFDRVQKRQVDARSPEKGSNTSNVFTYLMLYPADQQTIDKKRGEIKALLKAERDALTDDDAKKRLQSEIEKREHHMKSLREIRKKHKKLIREAFEAVGLKLEDKALKQFEDDYAVYKQANP